MNYTEMRNLMAEATMMENAESVNKEEAALKNYEMDLEEEIKEANERVAEGFRNAAESASFFNNVKNTLIAECLYKLYKESVIVPMTSRDKVIARNLVNNFVVEHGAQNLIRDFSTKTLMLSEMSRICTKYYKKILEECEECETNIVSDGIKDDFLAELEELDTTEASKLIKDRVSDAVGTFVDSNMQEKLEYQELINAAKDQIDSTTNESYIEEYNNAVNREINERRLNRSKNVFHCMVESLVNKSLKDEQLKEQYVDGTKINMQSIVEDTQLMYTMLEMVNTSNMITINEQYLNDYIKSL